MMLTILLNAVVNFCDALHELVNVNVLFRKVNRYLRWEGWWWFKFSILILKYFDFKVLSSAESTSTRFIIFSFHTADNHLNSIDGFPLLTQLIVNM